MRVTVCRVLLSAMSVLCSCAPGPSDDVIATYDGGEVTAGDVDRAMLAMTAAERTALTGDASGLERVVREMVADRLLLAEAQALGPAETAELGAAVLEEERDAIANLCVAGRITEPTTPSDGELRKTYERNLAHYRRPARRLVYHIFLRQGAGSSRQDLRDRADEVRQRVLAGESFSHLAEEVSESESRHWGGLLGWLTREECPGDLGDIIFSLDLQRPSDPVGTRDGFHLFFVESAFEDKQFSFEEMRFSLLQHELARQRSEALEELTDGVELPPGSFVPTQQEQKRLMSAGNPDSVLFRVGDYELRAGDAIPRVEQLMSRGEPAPPAVLLAQMLATTLLREKVNLLCSAEGWVEQEAIDEVVQAIHNRALTQSRRRARLLGMVDKDPKRLAEYFNRNRLRFAGPVRFHLLRLTVPQGLAPAATMAQLEGLCRRPELDLEQLAADLDGSVDDLGRMSISELRVLDPRAAAFVMDLDIGGTSPPYRVGETLVLVQLTGRQEPVVPELDEIKDRVRQTYVEENLQQLYRELEEEMLTDAGFRLFSDHLSRAAQATDRSTSRQ